MVGAPARSLVSCKSCRPPNVLALILHVVPFLFHLIPFQKYPSLIKNRRNRTTAKTILSHPLKNISFLGLFTKNPFFPHERLTPATTSGFSFFGLFRKRRPPTLFHSLHSPERCRFRFSHFLAASLPHTHISRNSKLFSSVKRPSLLARKRGDSSGFYVFAPSSLRGAAPKMYTFVPYHDDDSYSNYNLNGQPDGCTQNTKDWREVIFASCVTWRLMVEWGEEFLIVEFRSERSNKLMASASFSIILSDLTHRTRNAIGKYFTF